MPCCKTKINSASPKPISVETLSVCVFCCQRPAPKNNNKGAFYVRYSGRKVANFYMSQTLNPSSNLVLWKADINKTPNPQATSKLNGVRFIYWNISSWLKLLLQRDPPQGIVLDLGRLIDRWVFREVNGTRANDFEIRGNYKTPAGSSPSAKHQPNY